MKSLEISGITLAGGDSIRIHQREVQEKVLKVLSMEHKAYEGKFGFLLSALDSDTPHGGIAIGFNRLVLLLCSETSIRAVMAFPKTPKAACLLTGALSSTIKQQLDELQSRSRPRLES